MVIKTITNSFSIKPQSKPTESNTPGTTVAHPNPPSRTGSPPLETTVPNQIAQENYQETSVTAQAMSLIVPSPLVNNEAPRLPTIGLEAAALPDNTTTVASPINPPPTVRTIPPAAAEPSEEQSVPSSSVGSPHRKLRAHPYSRPPLPPKPQNDAAAVKDTSPPHVPTSSDAAQVQPTDNHVPVGAAPTNSSSTAPGSPPAVAVLPPQGYEEKVWYGVIRDHEQPGHAYKPKKRDIDPEYIISPHLAKIYLHYQ